jgi:hypothetical protein
LELELEFSSREISAMPLDRRVRFCGTAAAAVGFEELRKNFITFSETDDIDPRTRSRHQPAIGYEDAEPDFPASF